MNGTHFRAIKKREQTGTPDPSFERLVERLEHLSGRSLDVRLHRNRWTYFACRPLDHSRRVRVGLHEMFLDAPAPVLRAVATLIRRNNARARQVIRSFVAAQSPRWEKQAVRAPRPLRIVTRGKAYDLQGLFHELNARYFGGRCSANITWGNGHRSARGQRQITFGTYDKSANVIRIHPALDSHRVPEYFVRYITFHEMLHATLPPPLSPSGRCLYHSRLFRQRERMFEDFQRAQAYGKHFVEEVI